MRRRFAFGTPIAVMALVLAMFGTSPAGAVTASAPSIVAVPSGVYTVLTKAIKIRNIPQVPTINSPDVCKKLGCDQPPPPQGSDGIEAAAGCTGSCFDHGFGMVWAYRNDGTKIAYRWASGSHYAGTAPYHHHAHGTLIRGWNYEGDQVWSQFTSGCAGVSAVNNPEIKTCGSPDFNTKHGGQWLIVGGFTYDHYNDGVDDWECAGCIDQRFAVP